MIKRGITVTIGSAIAAAGFNAEYSHELKGMLKDIEDTYLKAGYEIPATEDVYKRQAIEECVKTAGAEVVYSSTECFV